MKGHLFLASRWRPMPRIIPNERKTKGSRNTNRPLTSTAGKSSGKATKPQPQFPSCLQMSTFSEKGESRKAELLWLTDDDPCIVKLKKKKPDASNQTWAKWICSLTELLDFHTALLNHQEVRFVLNWLHRSKLVQFENDNVYGCSCHPDPAKRDYFQQLVLKTKCNI